MVSVAEGSKDRPRKEPSRTFYVPPELKVRFETAVTKIQRRRPGQSMSKIFVDLVVEEADRHRDIPGLDIPEVPSLNGHES